MSNEPAQGGLLTRIPPVPFALFALGGIFLLYQVVGGVITFLLMGTRITPDNVTLVRWATLVSQLLFLLLPTLLLARYRTGSLAGFFRLQVPHPGVLAASLVAVLALQQILSAYMMLQDALPLPVPVEKIVDQLRTMLEEMYRGLISASSVPEFLFVVLVIAVTPAVCEEMLFRGLVQRSFEGAARPLTAAVLAGVIFGAYHVNPFSMLPLMVLGSFFGFLVYRSGSILTAMAAHFLNNFTACLVMYLNLNEDFVALAPASAPTPGLVAANAGVAGMVFLAAMFYVVRRTPQPGPASEEGISRETL